MDFSTIKKKINQDEYSNILEFRADFELMCDNAMKYNRSETIYWQAARKLLTTGTKLMTKDKLINLRRTVECFSRLTERELGFHIDSTNHTNDEQLINSHEQMDISLNDNDRKSKIVLKLPRYYEKLPTLLADEEDDEELSPEEILSQAQQAAQCAREKLSLRRPISAYTLSCQRTNGTTSLRFINQDDLSQQQSQTRTITIGELSNLPSSAGAPSASAYHPHPTPIVNENEKRNHLLPRYFLDYGPFSSHAPQYDSSFSSISKDELDLLIHTYGSEFSAQYAVSLIDYVKDSGDLALSYVDRVLSVLTNGEHENLNTKRDQLNNNNNNNDHFVSSINGSNHIESHGNTQHQLDMKLDENAKLLVQLRQAQYDRLCQPSNKVHQIIPSSSQQQTNETLNEYDLAEKVLYNLSDMTHISSNGPEQVITPEIIRHNLGVVINNESLTIDSL
jgi:bromodomain-containing protein 7/9